MITPAQTRQPIAFEDIRVGDVVERERLGVTSRLVVHARGDAHVATDQRQILTNGGDWFLIDRPASKIELPTEPTLGWATWEHEGAGGRELAVWRHVGAERKSGGWLNSPTSSLDDRDVTAFTPATVVPTEALDELRRTSDAQQEGFASEHQVSHAASLFLQAVDEAGEQS